MTTVRMPLERPDAASIDLGNSLFFASRATPLEPLTCFYGVQLSTPTTLEALARAVAVVIAQTPRLASVCRRGRWTPLPESAERTSQRIVLHGRPDTAEAMLAHYIDLSTEPAWRVVFVAPDRLHFGIHHALSDGMGMTQILSDTMQALAGETLSTDDNGLRYSLAEPAPLDAEWIGRELERRRGLAKLIGAVATGQHIRVEQTQINNTTLRTAFAAVAPLVPQLTLHDFLLAALHRALAAQSNQDTVVVWQPIDLRRELPGALRIGNQVTSGLITSTGETRRDPIALLQDIVAQMRALKTHKLEARVVERLCFKEKIEVSSACAFAHLGADWGAMAGIDRMREIDCVAGPRASMPLGTLLALTWRDRLRLSWARFAANDARTASPPLLETLHDFL